MYLTSEMCRDEDRHFRNRDRIFRTEHTAFIKYQGFSLQTFLFWTVTEYMELIEERQFQLGYATTVQTLARQLSVHKCAKMNQNGRVIYVRSHVLSSTLLGRFKLHFVL